jgi:hypothetical protein
MINKFKQTIGNAAAALIVLVFFIMLCAFFSLHYDKIVK